MSDDTIYTVSAAHYGAYKQLVPDAAAHPFRNCGDAVAWASTYALRIAAGAQDSQRLFPATPPPPEPMRVERMGPLVFWVVAEATDAVYAIVLVDVIFLSDLR